MQSRSTVAPTDAPAEDAESPSSRSSRRLSASTLCTPSSRLVKQTTKCVVAAGHGALNASTNVVGKAIHGVHVVATLTEKEIRDAVAEEYEEAAKLIAKTTTPQWALKYTMSNPGSVLMRVKGTFWPLLMRRYELCELDMLQTEVSPRSTPPHAAWSLCAPFITTPTIACYLRLRLSALLSPARHICVPLSPDVSL